MSEVAKQWWPSTIYAAPEETIEPLHIVWINKSGNTDPYVTVTKADTLQYSYDNSNWVNASSANISGNQMDGGSQYHVYIRRRPDLEPITALFSSTSVDNKWTINGGQARISGNIMSLLGQNKEVGEHAFAFLFYLNSDLIDASGLEMPATKLAYSCYSGMFHSCTALTGAPALPATTLAPSCYQAMFCECAALATTPALPATTLAEYCYGNMFLGCTSLTSIPDSMLPATILAARCYSSMFKNCTSLSTVPELRATTMAPNCYQSMFYGCTALTSIRQLPETTTPTTVMAESCWESMFENCSGINDTVIIHATVLATKCCRRMFRGCSSLTSVAFRLATDISAVDALDQWLNNTAVGTTGTLYVLSETLKQWKKDGEVPNNWSIQPI